MGGKTLKRIAVVVVIVAISFWLLLGQVGGVSPHTTSTDAATDHPPKPDVDVGSSTPSLDETGTAIDMNNNADGGDLNTALVAAGGGGGGDAAHTQVGRSKGVVVGAPAGVCPKLSRKFINQFHLNAYLVNPKESVEVQIFNAFGPVLDQRCKLHASNPSVSSSTGPLGFFVDVGGNNGVDVAYWLKRFGGCDGPCGCGNTSSSSTPTHQGLHFIVFEPQEQYQALLNGMASTRDAMLAQQVAGGAPQKQRPLTVIQAAVGKSSQHDTNLVLVGDGEQGVVNLDENKKVQLKRNEHLRTVIKIKSLAKVLEGIAPSSPPVVALKVDAEGADATILVASTPLFTAGKIDFVIFELNKNVRFFDVGYGQSVEMLRQAGYRTFLVGVAKTGSVEGMLTYIALEVDRSFFRRLRVSLETIIAVSPSMAATMQERAGVGANLFGAVGVNGRLLSASDPLLSKLSTACYLSAFAWEGPHRSRSS